MIYFKLDESGRVAVWQRGSGKGLGDAVIELPDEGVLGGEYPCNYYRYINGRLVLDPPAESAGEPEQPDAIELRLDEIEYALMELAMMIGGEV